MVQLSPMMAVSPMTTPEPWSISIPRPSFAPGCISIPVSKRENCDINLADANNDGTLDLVVTVNAYGGLSNGLKTRSAVYLYPLNSALTNAKPNFSE